MSFLFIFFFNNNNNNNKNLHYLPYINYNLISIRTNFCYNKKQQKKNIIESKSLFCFVVYYFKICLLRYLYYFGSLFQHIDRAWDVLHVLNQFVCLFYQSIIIIFGRFDVPTHLFQHINLAWDVLHVLNQFVCLFFCIYSNTCTILHVLILF